MEASFFQLSPPVEMEISTAEEPTLASPTPRWEPAPLPFPLGSAPGGGGAVVHSALAAMG